ncbi:glucose 1-dehydrogenase 2 [bacterium BMS3Bbin03]|nr:glucose 1-dehydrogenase 2 [bacterium BMS3Bbin03]
MKRVYLENKWDEEAASKMNGPELLRYRSNLLGSDLRITNFGGGNTSSKIHQADPVTGEETEVLWVKGSGGDLGSITLDGFACLYMDRFLALKQKYRGRAFEDEMVGYYPLCRFGLNDRPASIDTPLHGLLAFKHIDHMHPDWAIALAASANGKRKLAEFNERFGRHLIWIPWQRPGYHLGRMLEDAVHDHPESDGIILASHGLLTWGNTQYDCYRNTIDTIDALGQFVVPLVEAKGDELFGGAAHVSFENRREWAHQVFPYIRGRVGAIKPLIGSFVDSPEVLRFVNSRDAQKLAFQGTSCPDHFVRTKVRPFYVDWDPVNADPEALKKKVEKGLVRYRKDYEAYYRENKESGSPAMRNPNPTVVLVPGIGLFSFGKNKKEARITGEFYVNAIHVMEGATALNDGQIDSGIEKERVINNYVALPPREAFRIEYWALEEAKLRRQPPEKEMARKIALVVGAGSGIGRVFCSRLIKEGAQVVAADLDMKAAGETAERVESQFGRELVIPVSVDITDRLSVQQALRQSIFAFGGVDILVNTAAVFIPPDKGDRYSDKAWDQTLKINIAGNVILVEEFAAVIREQDSLGTVLLTSSANAVVPKAGSEPYDVSKAAVNHLVREFAIRYAPKIRINGVSPATVVEGSSMFPRHRVIASLKKYNIDFSETEETKILLRKLANYYAQRTLNHLPIRTIDVVEAGYFLLSPRSSRTTGHLIPVDGGLMEAFLR